MNEFYRVPALALLSMLLVAFALLYLQARTPRRLLWLIGWSMTALHLATQVAGIRSAGWGFALQNASLVLAPLMFLGSMSPLGFKRWPRILYAYAFAVPLLLFAVIISLAEALRLDPIQLFSNALANFRATRTARMKEKNRAALPGAAQRPLPRIVSPHCRY